MNWDDRCNVARVRMLAIAAEVRAGGRPAAARMRHAMAPLAAGFVDELAAAGRARARSSPAARRRDPVAPEL